MRQLDGSFVRSVEPLASNKETSGDRGFTLKRGGVEGVVEGSWHGGDKERSELSLPRVI